MTQQLIDREAVLRVLNRMVHSFFAKEVLDAIAALPVVPAIPEAAVVAMQERHAAAIAAPPDSAARIAELEEALREVRDREARNRAPWTHEAAADEYSRMLACDRDTARRALATNSRKEGEGK